MTHHSERISRRLRIWAPGLLVLVAVAACNEPASPPPSTATDATFAVEGMTCASCTVTVSTAAKGVDGVYEARADVEQRRAWVSYDAHRTDPAAIAAAITRAGYETTPIPD